MREWVAKELAEARLTPEYWQERYEIERGEVIALTARVRELEEAGRLLGQSWRSEADIAKSERVRAEAAEAEVERLKQQVAGLEAGLRYSASYRGPCWCADPHGHTFTPHGDCPADCTDHSPRCLQLRRLLGVTTQPASEEAQG